MNPYRLRAYLFLLATSIIWAFAGPIIKFTLGGIEPIPFLLYRFAISGIVAIIIFIFTGFHFSRKPSIWILTFIYGFFTSTFSLGFLFLGMNLISVLHSSVESIIAPLFVIVASVIFLKEHISKHESLGLFIAIIGTILTIIEPIKSGGLQSSATLGFIFVFIYLIGNTISSVLLKVLLRDDIKPSVLSNLSFIVGFFTTLPIALVKYQPQELISSITHLKPEYHLGVLFMALISGTLGYALWNLGQKSVEVSEAAIFSYLYPILTIPIAMLWLKEEITPLFVFGCVVIGIGVFISEYKRRKELKKNKKRK